MRRIAMALAVIGMFASLSPAAFAQSTQRTVQPLDNDLSQCNGESIALSGDLILLTQTFTDSAGRLHLHEHHVFQNVTGVGTESGSAYRLIGASSGTQLIVEDLAQPLVITGHGMFQQLTSGATGDFRINVITHLTRSPSGEVVVFFERGDAFCT